MKHSIQKILITVIACFIFSRSFCQTKVSTLLLAQYNTTMYDRTAGNNPWGVGLGLQTLLINKSKFTPTIELTADLYLENDKVYRMNADGSAINTVPGMINLFAGTSFHPVKNLYMSVVGGPSFINGQTLFGIKPSLGFYFSRSHRCTGKISYINIFKRDKTTKEDFGSLSFAVGIKLF